MQNSDLKFPLFKLWLAHVFIITLSNYAVQIPVSIGTIHSTLGTFTYPFIFLLTDLTVRIYGQQQARKTVFLAMLPALFLSYVVGTVFEHGTFCGLGSLSSFSIFVFRISLASFAAYILGQLADIFVFQRLRALRAWWPAPATSSVFGNLLDTYAFFFVAFYHTTDAFMAEHWFALATFDYAAKLTASLLLFVPIYGMVLKLVMRLFADAELKLKSTQA
ncbi:MAG: 7-cyano-7-deazaguanine/7-aminomethyl-7-deazaguanine transporter [Succinivibrio sp.]|nr:7-cyano-7-deazaguanine/7-aminomethyl-7-deazaguanine transporter [Succinivibrio sp.]